MELLSTCSGGDVHVSVSSPEATRLAYQNQNRVSYISTNLHIYPCHSTTAWTSCNTTVSHHGRNTLILYVKRCFWIIPASGSTNLRVR